MAGRLFNSVVQWISRIGIIISSVILAAMMCLTAVDVILRYCFNKPLGWSYEITELLLVFIVFSGLLYVQMKKGHVSVDILVSRLPAKSKYIVEVIVTIISFVLVSLMAWQTFVAVQGQMESNLSTGILRMPIYPFVVVAACGIAMLCLGFLKDIIDLLAKRK
jgi:TRAP-type C4-dicarboxylate transport system permease small subunit